MLFISQCNSKTDAYEECLKQYGYEDHFPKKNARILFNKRNAHKTSEILVAEFADHEKNQHLYKHYSCDIGNCLSDWDEWSLSDILLKLFVFYGIEDEVRIKAVLELCKITEFRRVLSPWVHRYFN